jgi:hypothetical protein
MRSSASFAGEFALGEAFTERNRTSKRRLLNPLCKRTQVIETGFVMELEQDSKDGR